MCVQARIAREKRLVPELSYFQSTFEAAVLTLSSATFSPDYAKDLTRSKARDFKLQRGVWRSDEAGGGKRRARSNDSDYSDSEGKASRKSQRPIKASGQVKSSQRGKASHKAKRKGAASSDSDSDDERRRSSRTSKAVRTAKGSGDEESDDGQVDREPSDDDALSLGSGDDSAEDDEMENIHPNPVPAKSRTSSKSGKRTAAVNGDDTEDEAGD